MKTSSRFRPIVVILTCLALAWEGEATRLAFAVGDEGEGEAHRASPPPFDPAACASTRIPYQRRWDGDPNTPGRFQVPKYDLPMMCEGHNIGAPFLLMVANGPNKTVVDWLSRLHGVPYEVYHAESENEYHNFPSIANEAGAYLKFIVEHYDCLPDVTLFAHSHNEQTWHRYETLEHTIQELRMARLSRINGYAILNKEGGFDKVALRQPRKNLKGHEAKDQYDAGTEGCGNVVNGTMYGYMDVVHYERSNLITEAWDIFLGPAGLGPVPEWLGFSYGAEFLVKRSRIKARPRKFYLDALSFMISYLEAPTGDLNSFRFGVVWESIWHVVFGVDSYMTSRVTPVCDLFFCSKSE